MMGKSVNEKKRDRRCDDDHGGDEEEQLAPTPSRRPTKRQKTLLNSICNWLHHKFICPLVFDSPSPSASSSSSDYNNNINNSSSRSRSRSSSSSGSGSAASRPDVLQSSKYDVFISFRGVDVRDSFFSHLYTHLKVFKRLAVYKDDVDLERGEQISPALLLAIERSEVYIVILSSHFADSPWCLEELEKILECKERYGRRVIPVFYGVDVENQKLPSALREVSKISGFDSRVIRPEPKFIELIAQAVFQAIRGSSQMVSNSVSRGLVGMERRVLEVEKLLCLEEGGNSVIGLWGVPGIGKTTLARAVFDRFNSQFEASYFLPNFADTVTSGLSRQPLRNVQNDMFSALLGDENGRAGGTSSSDLTLNRLGRLKSLVVIDDAGNDVGDIGQVKELLNGQYCDLFGPGSVIIMTSRNRQLLKGVCDDVYEVEPLNYGEAYQLFCLHAFKGNSPHAEYVEVAQKAIDYCSGNPLAITVMGSNLYGRDPKYWDRELKALQDNPNPVIEDILRKSYDGLNQVENDAFLDLACFYHYWRLEKFEKLEEMFEEDGKGNLITNLMDKCLLRIDDTHTHSCIEMHSLLQDLGRKIVNEKYQVRKRSRLWTAKDVYRLFKENKGTEYIEGILWDFGDIGDREYKERDLHIQPDAFVKMESLRILVIRHDSCNLVLPLEGLKCLPNELRILEWYSFASKCLPSQFSAENLVKLHLRNSTTEQLWEDEVDVDLGNLKFLNLNGSTRLKKLPNLSTAKRLMEVHLKECANLVELPTSILDLPELEFLDVSSCSCLKLNNLESFTNCSQGQSVRHSNILPNLKKLFLSGTPIQKVPDFIIHLHILELYCEDCTKLTELPLIPSLERLSLTSSLIKVVIELEKLTELKWLKLDNNKQLIHISNDFCKLKSLQEIQLIGCSQVKEFPDSIISTLTPLESLDLSYTAVKELPASIGDLTRLSRLLLTGCKSLASLPNTIHKLSNLEILGLSRCDQLIHLPELPSSLQFLDACGCNSLQTLSIDIIEKHDLSKINCWNFSRCWKLDEVLCSKLVDKFTQDLLRSPGFSRLLLPTKCGSKHVGENGSITGSDNSNTMATVKFRGQPWKLRSLILCVLLNSPPLGIADNKWSVECMLRNEKDDAGSNMIVSTCHFREYEDQEVEHLSNDQLLVWSTNDFDTMRARQIVGKKDVDDGTIVEFLFHSSYWSGSKSQDMPLLIKNCRVIPVYDDTLVTYEDDKGQIPDNVRGLYDEMCARQ